MAKAEQKNVPLQIRAIGSVQPVSTVSVRAQVNGELTRVWFREGEDVRKGQMLFTIDPRPYEAALQQAQANLARDEANVRQAESEAQRYAGLVQKDYVTKEDYEKMTSTAEAARATAAADRAAVENTRLQLAYCSITSPIDGRTGGLMVHAGNLVQASSATPLVVINQITPVYVQFAIPESQLGQVRARGGVGVPVAASPQGGGKTVDTGKLSFIDNAVDTTTGTITLKALFPNSSRALWPGQFVTVAMTLAERPNSVVVPTQAVQTGQRGQYVYVVKADSSVEMRPVSVEESMNQETIIGSGVQPGETVVTDGQLRLTPKSHVDVKNAL
ncbi:MAG TPA: efflux RND transporter periplasmic adaptor subunit [Thermoanaerobaculia bacterium]|nr:efflux RND transporter periplasmic adaptor subunit [Thermoanaerobaculia bacterium]